jgi:ABC-type antimicrobial peptide transport system permease subunit
MAFVPVAQLERPPEYVNLLVRMATPGAVRVVAETIGRVEPQAVLLTLPLQAQVTDLTLRERLLAILSLAFAAAAALLAVLGLYGAVAYGITQRVQEIGIRMVLSGIGVGAGLVAAVISAPYLESLLYGLNPRDPAVFVAVAVVFPLVAIAAAYVPARRATKVDPLTALRCD